jgi:hypothetical protein
MTPTNPVIVAIVNNIFHRFKELEDKEKDSSSTDVRELVNKAVDAVYETANDVGKNGSSYRESKDSAIHAYPKTPLMQHFADWVIEDANEMNEIVNNIGGILRIPEELAENIKKTGGKINAFGCQIDHSIHLFTGMPSLNLLGLTHTFEGVMRCTQCNELKLCRTYNNQTVCAQCYKPENL